MVELERIASENFVEYVRPRLYEGVVDHLNDLKMRGTAVVLVSSSPKIVLEPLSAYLGCSDTITTPVRDRARPTWSESPTGPHVMARGSCIGPENGRRSRRQIAMDEAAAYADNWSDRALLGQVGRAVVVHPHRKLKRLALERGWDIVHPRSPSRSRLGRSLPI